MFCAISGKPPQVAVVSPKSHCVFEKSLIEKYILENGTDPVTNDPLAAEELITINAAPLTSSVPTTSQTASIPGLLSALQGEYDALILELFQLRSALDTTKKELSTALYQYDAAVRVASAAIKERDNLRAELARISIAIGTHSAETNTQTPRAFAIPSHISELLKEKMVGSMKVKNPYKPVFSASDVVASVKKTHDWPIALSSCNSFTSGDQTVISSLSGEFYVLEGENVVAKGQIDAQVTSVSIVGGQLVVGCANGEFFKCSISDTAQREYFSLKNNGSKVISVLQHPHISDLIVVVSDNGSWSLSSIDLMQTYFHYEGQSACTYASIHKDGLLLALAVGNDVVVYNLSDGTEASRFSHSSTVKKTLFGANGYWLFALTSEKVTVWDLRKQNSVASELNVEHAVSMAYDASGTNLCIVKDTGYLILYAFVKKEKQWVEKHHSTTLSKKWFDVAFSGREIHLIDPEGLGRTLAIEVGN